MNRIFVTGDTHGDIDLEKVFFYANHYNLDESDVLIIAGDAGFIYYKEGNREEKRIKESLKSIKAIILCVLGNHENYDRIEKLPSKSCFGGKVLYEPEYPYILYATNGEIYTINNKTFWTFSGATSIDKFSRTLGLSYWTQEIPSYTSMAKAYEALQKVKDCGKRVDYIITHTAPASIVKSLGYERGCPVANYLEEIYNSFSDLYTHWYCGHFHIDRDVVKAKLTFIYYLFYEL